VEGIRKKKNGLLKGKIFVTKRAVRKGGATEKTREKKRGAVGIDRAWEVSTAHENFNQSWEANTQIENEF